MSHAQHINPDRREFDAHLRPLNRDKLADALLSSALDCIVVSDVLGRIVEFNAPAEQTFG